MGKIVAWLPFLTSFPGRLLLTLEISNAANMKMAVFWVFELCSLVEFYRRFRVACYLQRQSDEAVNLAAYNSLQHVIASLRALLLRNSIN
jgi:hypothetical protein